MSLTKECFVVYNICWCVIQINKQTIFLLLSNMQMRVDNISLTHQDTHIYTWTKGYVWIQFRYFLISILIYEGEPWKKNCDSGKSGAFHTENAEQYKRNNFHKWKIDFKIKMNKKIIIKTIESPFVFGFWRLCW